jgi:D-3-phosphoglycerate dehydrogenase
MYKILVTDNLGAEGLEKLSQAEDANYTLKTGLTTAELASILPEYDAVIVRSSTQVDQAVLATAVNLKIIGRAGIGIDNIDVTAASMRGIIVMNTPQANSIALE